MPVHPSSSGAKAMRATLASATAVRIEHRLTVLRSSTAHAHKRRRVVVTSAMATQRRAGAHYLKLAQVAVAIFA